MFDRQSTKPTATLKNWYHDTLGNMLYGNVYGHHSERLFDGLYIHTSTVINLDRANNRCETLNTIYTLENEQVGSDEEQEPGSTSRST